MVQKECRRIQIDIVNLCLQWCAFNQRCCNNSDFSSPHVMSSSEELHYKKHLSILMVYEFEKYLAIHDVCLKNIKALNFSKVHFFQEYIYSLLEDASTQQWWLLMTNHFFKTDNLFRITFWIHYIELPARPLRKRKKTLLWNWLKI